jgi:phosphoenolpyruvate synthase/pyruvate phosphate dikinase
MSPIIPLERITEAERLHVGGKAYTLSVMAGTGAKVPRGVCVTVDAYRRYVRLTGLADRIRLELSRKNFTEMRCEEIWDASLRISLLLRLSLSSSTGR